MDRSWPHPDESGAAAGKSERLTQVCIGNQHTPVIASWLNHVKRWFGSITQQAIRRGSFKSAPDLVGRINRYTEHCNLTAQPFVWTATADSILTKLDRLCEVINGTGQWLLPEKIHL